MTASSTQDPDLSAKWEQLRTHVSRLRLPDIGQVERELLVALKLMGDQTVPALAVALSMSEAAIRQHLRQLEGEDLVSYWTEPAGTSGRPPRIYTLTAAAHAVFPTFSPAIGNIVLSRMAEADPDTLETFLRDGLDGAVRRAVAAWGGPGAGEDGVPRADAVQYLKTAVASWGYMPEVIERGDDLELILNHCPFQSVVEAFPAFCNLEQETFKISLQGCTARRVAHRFSGDRVCAYLLQFAPGDAPSSKADADRP